jgi:hypothetical protein
MIYEPPIYEGKQQYVPIVSKNVDQLIGFLRGVNSYLDVVTESLEMVGLEDVEFDVTNADFLDLSSLNFNDIMEDGRRESTLSKKDKEEYFYNLMENAKQLVMVKYEKTDAKYTDILRLSCRCELGHYFWHKYSDIPTDTFKCEICGRVLIHYTGHDDWDYEFDENITKE